MSLLMLNSIFKKTIQNQYGEQNCCLNVKPCLKCDERAQNNTHKEPENEQRW